MVARPRVVSVLAEPAHLVQVWTGRCLDTGGQGLAVGLATAVEQGRRVVLLTHHARPLPRADAGLVVVTTHTPGTPAPAPPVSPYRHHLPADPAPRMLTDLVATLTQPTTTT